MEFGFFGFLDLDFPMEDVLFGTLHAETHWPGATLLPHQKKLGKLPNRLSPQRQQLTVTSSGAMTLFQWPWKPWAPGDLRARNLWRPLVTELL